MPANEYYDSSGAPSTNSSLESATLRAEYDKIEEGFNRLPTLTGNEDKPVFVNAGGSGLEAKSTASALLALGAQGTSGKDASNGYVGLSSLKIKFMNALGTFTSYFTNANTASRTYTFQDRDGTIADDTDLALKADAADLASKADTTALHDEEHTIASHSDTTATGAELETLTDNSMADSLHRHSELSGSDGDPDPALSVDADGKVSLSSGTGINEFSTDATMAGDSDDAVPTEKAVKGYVDTEIANAGLYSSYVKVSDVKTLGTAGGTFTQGAWQTRDINTEDSDADGICSVASNQITLEAGTYRCLISCPALYVLTNQSRLYDITGSAVLVKGTSERANTATHSTRSFITGRFTLSEQSVLEIQHRCEQSYSTYGFGYPASFDEEVYTIAEFFKEVD